MKDFFEKLNKRLFDRYSLMNILAHVSIVLSAMLLTFFIIDRFNTGMGFIDNDITKWLIGISAILNAVLSVFTVCSVRRHRRALLKHDKDAKK